MERLRWGWNNKKKADLLRPGREESGQRERLRGQRSWGGSTSGCLWNTHIRMSRARHLRRCSRWGWGGNEGPDLWGERKEPGLVLSVKGSSQGAWHRGRGVRWGHAGCTVERERGAGGPARSLLRYGGEMLVPEQGEYGRCSFHSSPSHAFQDHQQRSCSPVSACRSNDPRPKLILANLTKVMQAFKLILLVFTFILWSYQYYRLDCKHEEIYPQKEEAMPNNWELWIQVSWHQISCDS